MYSLDKKLEELREEYLDEVDINYRIPEFMLIDPYGEVQDLYTSEGKIKDMDRNIREFIRVYVRDGYVYDPTYCSSKVLLSSYMVELKMRNNETTILNDLFMGVKYRDRIKSFAEKIILADFLHNRSFDGKKYRCGLRECLNWLISKEEMMTDIYSAFDTISINGLDSSEEFNKLLDDILEGEPRDIDYLLQKYSERVVMGLKGAISKGSYLRSEGEDIIARATSI